MPLVFINKKTSKAKSVSADIKVRVKIATGITYRALVEKRNKKVTYLCQHIYATPCQTSGNGGKAVQGHAARPGIQTPPKVNQQGDSASGGYYSPAADDKWRSTT